MKSCERGATRTREVYQLDSPTRTANIRIRRSNYGSKLLQSPARPGYATRMRQLFEDAGSDHHKQRNNATTLYPQLPNISRKAAPLPIDSTSIVQRATTHASPRYRPESLCLSANLPFAVSSIGAPHVSLIDPSGRSSGSWSDDSGYIVTTRARSGSCTVPPNDRIRAWLLELPDVDRDAVQEHAAMEGQLMTVPIREQDSVVSTLHGMSEKNDSKSFPSLEDPFTCDHNTLYRSGRHDNGSTTESGGYRPQRNISDICRALNLDHLNQIHTPLSGMAINTSPKQQEDTQETEGWCDENDPLEEGGIQLSPLSPNVCIERGPSRYHSPRKLHAVSNAATPSKSRPTPVFRAPQLKENVVFGTHDLSEADGPLTPRTNRMGTRFRRPL